MDLAARIKRTKRILGQLITELRQERNISKARLALKSQLTEDTIKRIETGKSAFAISTILSLAQGFNMTLMQLMDRLSADILKPFKEETEL